MKSRRLRHLEPLRARRPPRRGAWIEIVSSATPCPKIARVAPRAGGRGLKFNLLGNAVIIKGSPPAQGGVD